MSLKAVLFDLDGTLLPMDQDVFIHSYLKRLAAKLVPFGYDPKKLTAGIWEGTGAMVANDGSKTNEEAFWERFSQLMGENVRQDEPKFDEFYRNEFQQVRNDCGFDENAAKAVAEIKGLGLRVTLATNPVFPAVATYSRTRWAGLDPQDFEIITTYEDSCHCKPNPDYYRDILVRMDLRPEECLMVGNDAAEDMVAGTIGMKTFLLTRDLINKKNKDISAWPHGDFADLLEYIHGILKQ